MVAGVLKRPNYPQHMIVSGVEVGSPNWKRVKAMEHIANTNSLRSSDSEPGRQTGADTTPQPAASQPTAPPANSGPEKTAAPSVPGSEYWLP